MSQSQRLPFRFKTFPIVDNQHVVRSVPVDYSETDEAWSYLFETHPATQIPNQEISFNVIESGPCQIYIIILAEL